VLIVEQFVHTALEYSDHDYDPSRGRGVLDGPVAYSAKTLRLIDTYLGAGAVPVSV